MLRERSSATAASVNAPTDFTTPAALRSRPIIAALAPSRTCTVTEPDPGPAKSGLSPMASRTLPTAQLPPNHAATRTTTSTTSIGRQLRNRRPRRRSTRRPPRAGEPSSGGTGSSSWVKPSPRLLTPCPSRSRADGCWCSRRVHRLACRRTGGPLGVDRSLQDDHRRGLVDHGTPLPALLPPVTQHCLGRHRAQPLVHQAQLTRRQPVGQLPGELSHLIRRGSFTPAQRAWKADVHEIGPELLGEPRNPVQVARSPGDGLDGRREDAVGITAGDPDAGVPGIDPEPYADPLGRSAGHPQREASSRRAASIASPTRVASEPPP